MSFFSKIFGTKGKEDKPGAEAQVGAFVPALSMHLRGELEPALAAYLAIAEEYPDDMLAPFFAAAIKAGKGNTAEAAETLRFLSGRAAAKGEAPSHAITLELVAQVRHQPTAVSIPAVAEIIVSLGDQLKKEGLLQESAVCFEIGAGLAPDNANVLHKLGDTLHDLRIYDYAESVLVEALNCAPNHWGALYSYAVLLQDLGRNEEAITFYAKAVNFNPDHVNCQNNYGAALLRTNRLAEALDHCTLAAKLDPRSPLIKINLGNIYFLMLQYQTARTCFAEAIALNSNLAPAYYGLASVEQALKSDPGQIKELYAKAISLNTSFPEAHHALGILLAADNDPEALAHFSLAAHLNGNLQNLHRDFGHACAQFGRREEALTHWKIAQQQNPDDVTVSDALARMGEENPV